MKLDEKEVDHVALLARLALTAEEKDLFRDQLSSILDYVEVINRLDTKDVQPTYHVLPIENVTRPDEQHQPLPQQDVLHNAPDPEGSYFKVPRIL
jgi:aspartyl-tRNA(Asn)/glutamyl-tRNA(Gln) amidotransferase subunit C